MKGVSLGRLNALFLLSAVIAIAKVGQTSGFVSSSPLQRLTSNGAFRVFSTLEATETRTKPSQSKSKGGDKKTQKVKSKRTVVPANDSSMEAKKPASANSRKARTKKFMVKRWRSQQLNDKKFKKKEGAELKTALGLKVNGSNQSVTSKRRKPSAAKEAPLGNKTPPRKKSRSQQRKESLPWTELKLGSLLSGKVQKLLPYGALVKTSYDIPGKTKGCAMLHIRQISADEKIQNITDVLQAGQQINGARVVSLNRESGKVGISLTVTGKRAMPTEILNVGENKSQQKKKKSLPWTELKPGSLLSGKVLKVLPFGALVKTSYDIPGRTKGCAMLHISQISDEKIQNITDVLQAGQPINGARVVSLNRESGKVGISLRVQGKRAAPMETLNVGDEIEGKVVRLKQYGAFVDVGCKRNALLHISRMSIYKVDRITDHAKAGQTVRVRVIRVDPDSKTIAVSMLSPENDKYVDRRDREKERMNVWQRLVDEGSEKEAEDLKIQLLELDRVIRDDFFESLGTRRRFEL